MRGVPGGVVGGVVVGSRAHRRRTTPARWPRRAPQRADATSGICSSTSCDRPVSIKQNQSALVPILQAHIVADRVSLWSPDGSAGERPLNAVWLTNTSLYTLDAGSVTLLDRNTYAGEALTEAIKPNERRLLFVRGGSRGACAGPGRPARLPDQPDARVARCRDLRDCQLRREDLYGSQRGCVGADGGDRAPADCRLDARSRHSEAVRDIRHRYRFNVPVEPRKSSTLVVREARAEEARFSVADIGADQVTGLARDLELGGRPLEHLRAILAKKAEIAGVDRELQARDAESGNISGNQGRVRENMKALKGSAEEKRLLERYVEQLSAQEDRLLAIKAEGDQLRSRRERLQAELTQMVEALTFDAGGSGASACAAR